jgi:hypothetical protein
MNEIEVDAVRNGLHKVGPGVYVGALMSPAQVARATKHHPTETCKALARWTLCGDVSPAAFSVLRAAGWPARVCERLTVLTSPMSLTYWVAAHQVGSFQHRFIAPLFDASVKTCVSALSRGEPLGYSMAGEGDQAVVWASRADAPAFAPVLALCTELPAGDEETVLSDYSAAVNELRHPERISSLIEDKAVTHTSVSVIAPRQILERLAARYGV